MNTYMCVEFLHRINPAASSCARCIAGILQGLKLNRPALQMHKNEHVCMGNCILSDFIFHFQ
ncbi:hypothetical protein DXN05_04075 [Deminuibacter soli]|uniref:Uncharacterized protein n=1 Tax=Deminuibacter soli TaxID=2291815 RepID=A0A3E1NQC4_9BACT|nr:hypothetical protein DXN05_04075 [Deminuibacter soli]